MSEFESVQRVDWDEFRHSLAFPFQDDADTSEMQAKAQDLLIRLCGMLPKFYGEDLDRMKMWERIASGLEVLASKLTDMQEMADIMLKHICADISIATSDRSLISIISEAEKLSTDAVKAVIGRKRIFIICKARDVWTSRFDGRL